MTRIYTLLTFILTTHFCYTQVYTKGKTRHRFAQMTLGFDVQSSFGGTSKYIDNQGGIQSLDINNGFSPRFLIGGTHFWGHADFYIAIPFSFPNFESQNQEVTAQRGVETVFKYYPLRIENHKIRPYIGTSLAPFYFEQRNNNFEFSSGPELNHTSFPLLFGLTFNTKNHLFELGFAWNYENNQDYFISRTQQETIATPPIYANLSYRFMFDTTLGAEKNWESGKTAKVTEALAKEGYLNGFYFGLGLSSAFWLQQGSYNIDNRPYISKYDTSIMPDFTLGYYLHKPDLNFAIGYRGYSSSTNAYGSFQQAKRSSFLFEATKYFIDYNGFASFIGPVISYENLSFTENFERTEIFDINEQKLSYGITFGWDIRPNRIQSWILRTNLRWYPNLSLDVNQNSKISFNTLEFNFIQFILYPSRLIKRKVKI